MVRRVGRAFPGVLLHHFRSICLGKKVVLPFMRPALHIDSVSIFNYQDFTTAWGQIKGVCYIIPLNKR